jgi:hypothetical protein
MRKKKPGECPENPAGVALISQLDVKAGPLHDMILDLVKHHVAITSTLPVFEMGSFANRRTIQKRVLDALSPDARTALLANKVRSSDLNNIREKYHADTSPWGPAFKKRFQ